MLGENFYLEIDGIIERHGFYTTIWVEAQDPESAEHQALEIIRNQEDLKSIVRNNTNDPPMIYLDEIIQLDSSEELGANEGRVFFREEKKRWWQFWKRS